eukprot:CAMPEP_0196653042 /NCGR_PEP_ID=MMETSP1086-20130531/2606_1 /TAXON_ID=77921 /ORGANISM="Cyanoptyche  gloeocystis , Strain SAG4.97" /LENGTH=564 /DNA_ID=CAMNT_0041984007 /DNA_START=34 /DNA_END=1728 /DNA_ORIENTATION=+
MAAPPFASSLNSQFNDVLGFVSLDHMSQQLQFPGQASHYTDGGEVQYVWTAIPSYETVSSCYPSHTFEELRCSNGFAEETRDQLIASQSLKHSQLRDARVWKFPKSSVDLLDQSQSFVHPASSPGPQPKPAASFTKFPLRPTPSGVPHVSVNSVTTHLRPSSSVQREDNVSNFAPNCNPSSASNSMQRVASGNKPLIQAVYDTKNGTIRFIRTGNTSRLGPQYLPVMRQNGMLRATNGVYFVPACPMGAQASGKPKVKRPQNSFLVFSNVYRPKLRAEHKNMSNAEVSKLLGEKWKNLSASEKQKYVEQAHRIKQEFNAMHPDYVYTKTPRRNKKRKSVALDEKNNNTEDEECDKSDGETDDVLLSEDTTPPPPSASPAVVDWGISPSSCPDSSLDSVASDEFPFRVFQEDPRTPFEVDSTSETSAPSIEPCLANVPKLTSYTSGSERQPGTQCKDPSVLMPQNQRSTLNGDPKPSVQLFVNPRFSNSSLPPFLRQPTPMATSETQCSIKPADFSRPKAQHGTMRFEVNSALNMPTSRVTMPGQVDAGPAYPSSFTRLPARFPA